MTRPSGIPPEFERFPIFDVPIRGRVTDTLGALESAGLPEPRRLLIDGPEPPGDSDFPTTIRLTE